MDTAWDVFGGVGGRSGITMPSPGPELGSGTLPAASRSNTLSVASSAGDLCGAGGSGLLTSDGVGGLCRDGETSGSGVAFCEGLASGGRGPDSTPFVSPLAGAFISFPCRELGGGGFFFGTDRAGCRLGSELLVSFRRTSPMSYSEASRDDWVVSCTACKLSDGDESAVAVSPSRNNC